MKIRKKTNMYTYHVKEMFYVSTCKRTVIKCCVYASLLFIAVVISLAPHFLTNNKKEWIHHRHARYATDLKYILFWNDHKEPKKNTFHYNDKEPIYHTGQNLFIKQKCSFINCFLTYNKSILPDDRDFDAVVFNLRDIVHVKLDEINLTRASHQKYIFRTLESAEKHPLCHSYFDNFFNWTWTYKLNSDIPHPNFNIYNESNVLIGPSNNITWRDKMKHNDRFLKKIKSKRKAVAWIVGKCKLKSKHEDFVNFLQSELKSYNYTLDIYGPCGKMDCPQGQSYKCYKMIEKDYFFQLVLEDSNAEDYVSDQILKVLTHVTIPIVLGGANYVKFLPPGSYVNANSFNTKKLGAIIHYLIQNPPVYDVFFDWMNHYHYTPRPSNYVCDLCAKLNTDITEDHSYHAEFRKWWNPDYEDICERMKLYNYFSKDAL